MTNNAAATEQAWALLSDKLRGFFRRRTSDDQVADDLLQETFVRIHRKLGDIDDIERINAWVFQIARHLVVDHYRIQSRDAAAVANDIEADTPNDANLNDLVAGWLPRMISQLPDTYREAVELYELKGVSQQDIADQLGLSLSNAKSRVQRGREKLKAMLFDCCSFEQDRRGNVIGYARNSAAECDDCPGCDA